jgi:hypothetical protein
MHKNFAKSSNSCSVAPSRVKTRALVRRQRTDNDARAIMNIVVNAAEKVQQKTFNLTAREKLGIFSSFESLVIECYLSQTLTLITS